MRKKTCSRCKEKKEVEQFYKQKTSSDGYDYYCKSCKKEYMNEKGYNKFNRKLLNEKEKEKQRQYSNNWRLRKMREDPEGFKEYRRQKMNEYYERLRTNGYKMHKV